MMEGGEGKVRKRVTRKGRMGRINRWRKREKGWRRQGGGARESWRNGNCAADMVEDERK